MSILAKLGKRTYDCRVNYRTLKSVLENDLDKKPLNGTSTPNQQTTKTIVHENLRRDFHQKQK